MNNTINISVGDKLKGYFALTKFRLSMTVVFSSCFGFAIAAPQLNAGAILLFALASYLVTASANVINQIKEKELDKLMSRTQNRPLPSGLLSVQEAIGFSVWCGVLGLGILFYFYNVYAFLLSFLSLLLYGFVYTPLKRVGPIAVAVGALPGAFPPMIGWVACTGHFGLEPGILFAIQFFWQFPHFWAIA